MTSNSDLPYIYDLTLQIDKETKEETVANIDQKLRQVLHDRRYQDETKPGYWDVIDNNVDYIKKVFADAGYVNTKNVQFRGFTIGNLMTCQEWQRRFTDELGKPTYMTDEDGRHAVYKMEWIAEALRNTSGQRPSAGLTETEEGK